MWSGHFSQSVKRNTKRRGRFLYNKLMTAGRKHFIWQNIVWPGFILKLWSSRRVSDTKKTQTAHPLSENNSPEVRDQLVSNFNILFCVPAWTEINLNRSHTTVKLWFQFSFHTPSSHCCLSSDLLPSQAPWLQEQHPPQKGGYAAEDRRVPAEFPHAARHERSVCQRVTLLQGQYLTVIWGHKSFAYKITYFSQ